MSERALVPSELAAAVDAFQQCEASYERARRALHEASRGFELVDAERRVRLEELRRLLAVEGRDPAGAAVDPPAGPDGHRPAAADGLPPLAVTCFGGFEVWREGRPVSLCSNRNGQAILRYLVVAPRNRASADALMELLWAEDPPRVARHKLHCALSALRSSLDLGRPRPRGGGYLSCNDGVYALHPAAVDWVDVDEFVERHRAGRALGGEAAVAHYEAACRLYRGPLLPEDLYADWSLLQREQLHQAYLAMCDAVASHHLAAGRHAEAAGWAWRVLDGNPCDEAACRVLMRALVETGRRDQAMRAYRHCERALEAELGVRPSAETTALLRAVARGDLHAVPAARDLPA